MIDSVIVVVVVAVVFAALGVSLTGCTAAGKQHWSHMRASAVGLQRHVVLYDMNGGVIKEWSFKGMVEDRGGSFRFLDSNDKAVTISGTVLIEEQ